MSRATVTLSEFDATNLVSAGFSDTAESTELLQSAMTHSVPRARVLALRGLHRKGELAVANLVTALGDSSFDVLLEALRLGADPHYESADLNQRLIQLVAHDHPLVCEAAVFALGERAVVDAREAVIAVTERHEDPRCREAGVVALAQIGGGDSERVVIAALKDKPTVRRRAVVALSSFESDAVEAALDDATEDRDWQVRSAVERLRRDVD